MATPDALQFFTVPGTPLALSADANCPGILDLRANGQFGNGARGQQVVIQPTVAADHTTGDETYIFNVVTSDNADLSSPTTVVSKTFLYSELVVGALLTIGIPEGVNTKRYLGLAFDGGGTTPTVTVNAWLQDKGELPNLFKAPEGFTA